MAIINDDQTGQKEWNPPKNQKRIAGRRESIQNNQTKEIDWLGLIEIEID